MFSFVFTQYYCCPLFFALLFREELRKQLLAFISLKNRKNIYLYNIRMFIINDNNNNVYHKHAYIICRYIFWRFLFKLVITKLIYFWKNPIIWDHIVQINVYCNVHWTDELVFLQCYNILLLDNLNEITCSHHIIGNIVFYMLGIL